LAARERRPEGDGDGLQRDLAGDLTDAHVGLDAAEQDEHHQRHEDAQTHRLDAVDEGVKGRALSAEATGCVVAHDHHEGHDQQQHDLVRVEDEAVGPELLREEEWQADEQARADGTDQVLSTLPERPALRAVLSAHTSL